MKKAQTIGSAFSNAFNGLFRFFLRERNGKIQLAAGGVAIIVSFLLRISSVEWIAILLCIAIVLGLEMLNSALEKLCDLVNPSWNPNIKEIKDVAAAAVLWASLISAIVGAIIFLPAILNLL